MLPALLASIATFGAAAGIGAAALASAVGSSQGLTAVQAGNASAGASFSNAAVSFGQGAFGGVEKHAKGGIFTSPTLGIIGEAGPEAVIPLDDFKNGSLGGVNVSVNLDIKEAKLNNPANMRQFMEMLSQELAFSIERGLKKTRSIT